MPRPSKPKPEAPAGPRLVRRTTSAGPKPAVQPDVTHDQIAVRAYEYFLQEGCVHGHHVDHWLRAELELKTVTPQPARRVAATRARG